MDTDYLVIFSRTALYLSAFIGVVRWKKLWEKGLKFFPMYLIFSVVIELIVYGIGDDVRVYAYALYDFVTYFFISFYFYLILDKDKLIIVFAMTYLIALLASLIIEEITSPLKIQSSVGTIIVFIYIVIYFTRLLQSDKVLSFYRLPSFWISVGLLIFNLGYLPVTFSMTTNRIVSREAVYILVTTISILLYTSYTIAFLCKKET